MLNLNYFTKSSFLLAVLFILETRSQKKLLWHEEKYQHRLNDMNDAEFKHFALNQLRSTSFESILDPILIPRVAGTENNAKVRKYIIENMKSLGWSIETDSFKANTPHGEKFFENIITTLNPDAPRRLVLACHHDSKYYREYNFVGATDSAVPCAMMLHIAHTLKVELDKHKNIPNQRVTLQMIFFDGEEAFNNWSDTDSLYGSRHLAEKWEKTPYPAGNRDGTNMLHRIDTMILLDLLGVKGPKLYSFFQSTSHLHSSLAQADQELRQKRMWTGSSPSIFKAQHSYSGVEDDHVPFLHRGVDILHLIPVPFPSVWHNEGDTKDALDFETIENLTKVLRIFVSKYLHLSS